jgi:hypothetical protein
VSLRRDQLIPVNKAVKEKEQLEKGLEEEEEKKEMEFCKIDPRWNLATEEEADVGLSTSKSRPFCQIRRRGRCRRRWTPTWSRSTR